MVTSHTAIVPLRSLFIVARWIFKSWNGSAFPLATAGAPAADACLAALSLDLRKKYPPTPTTMTTTTMPIQNPFGSFCSTSLGVSNINSSNSLGSRRSFNSSLIASHEEMKCELLTRRIRDSARDGSSLLYAGAALEIALNAREVHCCEERIRVGWMLTEHATKCQRPTVSERRPSGNL